MRSFEEQQIENFHFGSTQNRRDRKWLVGHEVDAQYLTKKNSKMFEIFFSNRTSRQNSFSLRSQRQTWQNWMVWCLTCGACAQPLNSRWHMLERDNSAKNDSFVGVTQRGEKFPVDESAMCLCFLPQPTGKTEAFARKHSSVTIKCVTTIFTWSRARDFFFRICCEISRAIETKSWAGFLP